MDRFSHGVLQRTTLEFCYYRGVLSPSSGIRETSKPPRVLVVDDNADSAELLCLLLERSRCIVKTVADPFAAVATALELLPHVALIDIGLPGMDGIQLLKAMRAEHALSECRFIAVTGYSAHEINSRIDDTGFDAHVTKPIDFEMLYKAIGAELLASGY